MKRVAIIGADFSPSSLPPANRVRFFAKHLPEFGWEPVVITTKPKFYDWSVDEENARLLSDSLSVIRTDAWRTDWTRKVGVGDIGMRAFLFQWRALKKLCTETNVDLVFVPVPPYVSMVLGRLAHRKFGIPYVIDYIDPWVSEYYWKVPKDQRPPKWALAYAMSRVLEPFAVKNVGHVTGVSQGTIDGVTSRYEHLNKPDATEIPYGAEPFDFDYVRSNPRPNPIFQKSDELFHLSYVGACIPGMHPTIRAIISAIKRGLNSRDDLFSKLRLHFVGTSYAANSPDARPVTAIASEFGLEGIVDERPARVSYLESLQVMLDSSALFLVGSDEAHYTASKVFPYLMAGCPLLAVFHEASSVVNILDGYAHAKVVTYRNAASLNEDDAILNTLVDILEGKLIPNVSDCDRLTPFTTKAMTARLVSAFDRALQKDKPVSRVVLTSEQQQSTSQAVK